jgi:uncharacterized membrane protein YbjE (DUF340 family)
VVTRLNTAIQALAIADVADFSLESPVTRKFGVPWYSLSASAISRHSRMHPGAMGVCRYLSDEDK